MRSVKKLGDVHSLGPKDCFGEVALLSSDGKRNATITAATPGALVVLDKDSYDSLLHMAHKRQTQTKLAFVHSLSLFDNVSKVSGGVWTSEVNPVSRPPLLLLLWSRFLCRRGCFNCVGSWI